MFNLKDSQRPVPCWKHQYLSLSKKEKKYLLKSLPLLGRRLGKPCFTDQRQGPLSRTAWLRVLELSQVEPKAHAYNCECHHSVKAYNWISLSQGCLPLQTYPCKRRKKRILLNLRSIARNCACLFNDKYKFQIPIQEYVWKLNFKDTRKKKKFSKSYAAKFAANQGNLSPIPSQRSV